MGPNDIFFERWTRRAQFLSRTRSINHKNIHLFLCSILTQFVFFRNFIQLEYAQLVKQVWSMVLTYKYIQAKLFLLVNIYWQVMFYDQKWLYEAIFIFYKMCYFLIPFLLPNKCDTIPFLLTVYYFSFKKHDNCQS